MQHYYGHDYTIMQHYATFSIKNMVMQHSFYMARMCIFYCDTALLLSFALMYTLFIVLKLMLIDSFFFLSFFLRKLT